MTTPDSAPMNDSIAYQSQQSPVESDCPSFQPIKRHDEFYISDDGSTSVFLVEDTLYKVHRYFLARESPIFHIMFDCPHPAEGQDGESDEKPIRLSGVSCSEFEALLDFFYNGMFIHERKNSECKVPKGNPQATLYDLLSISLRYEFDRVTREVVAHIDDSADGNLKDPVTKICFGVVHDSLKYWVQPAYNALIERNSFLTRDEIIRLGAGRSAIVGVMREKYIRGEIPEPNTSPWSFDTKSKRTLKVPPEFYSV